MRPEKKLIVDEFKNEIKDVNPLVFTDYTGIKAKDLTELRSKLTHIETKYKVVKNRLFKRSLEEVGLKEISIDMKGPLAIAYGGKDVVEVTKTLVKFAKDYPNTIKIKGGFIDNVFLPTSEIETLAKLPPKEVLFGQLIGQIAAPLNKLAMVLQGSIQKIVCVLDGIVKKKQEG